MIAKTVVGRIAKSTDNIYDYNIPAGLKDKLLFGARVEIPFGRGDKTETGFVVGFSEKSELSGLKDIASVLEETVLTPKMWELAQWIKKTYLCTYVEAINAVCPPGRGIVSVKANDRVLKGAGLCVPISEAMDIMEKIRTKAPMQYKILELLISNEFVALTDIYHFTGASKNAVDSLVKKEIAVYKEIEVLRSPIDRSKIEDTFDLNPTPEQKTVMETLEGAISSGQHHAFLLHGVTGSGKTEVFLQTIKSVVKKGRQAIVLVPEIALTPQMVERFCGRFGSRVAVLHSGLSLGERYDEWKRIASNQVDVVVGARSAVFAPFSDIGLIIVDEEHEMTYKSEMSPKYHAKEVAIKRAKDHGGIILFASATPSVESYYKAKNREYSLLTMKNRYNNAKMPETVIVDMREELQEGNKSIFSRRLKEEIEQNLANKQQTILFLNRRGYSSFVSCRNCGYVAECDHCQVSLTYHKSDNEMMCHYCGLKKPPPTSCPSCGSLYIRHFGIGTERVENDIRKAFPNASVLRMDADTTGTKQSHQIILDRFKDEKTDILIGTQMVSKGLDYPMVTLVGVLAADMSLNIDDFRARERTFNLITQVSGRAGRGEIAGRTVIQTYMPESDTLSLAKDHNYRAFYESEISIRKTLCYPPFCDIVMVLISATTENGACQTGRGIAKYIEENLPDVEGFFELLGPVPSPITKINNKYRFRIIIKCKLNDKIRNCLAHILQSHIKNKSNKNINVIIDFNPVNML